MKQPEDNRTRELPGLPSLAELLRQRGELQHKIDHPGRGRRRGQRIGAYKGAAKIGCLHMALRVRCGLSQAEFARLAGVSERTVRTWDVMPPQEFETMAKETRHAIIGALNVHGISYLAERQRQLQRTGKAVQYRDPLTGATWSGRGLMPKWLRVALDTRPGAKLSDFLATQTGNGRRPAALLRAPD